MKSDLLNDGFLVKINYVEERSMNIKTFDLLDSGYSRIRIINNDTFFKVHQIKKVQN